MIRSLQTGFLVFVKSREKPLSMICYTAFMRSCAVVVILLLCALLVSCYYPSPSPVDPYPYSFTDPSKPYYPLTESGARRFLEDVRAQWFPHADVPFEPVQDPAYSYAVLAGDCDDFSVMLAYYLQEYWGYDTFIALLSSLNSSLENHAVCFVLWNSFPPDIYESMCEIPTATLSGYVYRPLDWNPCTFWTWADYQLGLWLYGIDLNRYFKTSLEWYHHELFYMSVPTDGVR